MKYNVFASIDKSYDWANLPSLPILNDKTPEKSCIFIQSI